VCHDEHQTGRFKSGDTPGQTGSHDKATPWKKKDVAEHAFSAHQAAVESGPEVFEPSAAASGWTIKLGRSDDQASLPRETWACCRS
jgi:hypothetical protein